MSRFVLQKSEKVNNYVVTDTDNNCVISFEKGKFNETQKVTFLEEVHGEDFMKVARVLREVGEWLVIHHPEIAI